MSELRETKAENRSSDQIKDEKEEIAAFNQNTDYDPGIPASEDPLSPRNLAIQQFVVSARIYDALLTLIRLQGDSGASAVRDLLELHSAGHLLGPAPVLSGVFLTDEMNAEESTSSNQDATTD